MSENNRSWDAFALLLIDVQKDFWTAEMEAAYPDYEDNVARLLELSRQEGLEVVHLRASFREDKSDWMARYHFLDRIPCVEGTPGVELLPAARERSGEKIIVKQTFDGFENPELQAHLSTNNKRFLLVAGLVTSVCVLFTASTAAQRGYLVGIVEDCCGDKPEAHEHTLSRYPFVFERTTIDQISAKHEAWLAQLREISE